MENEHFSVSRVTNWHIIIIVNSPGRSLIKFWYREAQPWGPTPYLLRLSFFQKRYSFRIPFHSVLMVEGSSGLLQALYPQWVLKKVLYREALPRGPCPYLSTYHFWKKRYSFHIPFHPFRRLWGGVACYRHFIPRGYSTKFYTGKSCPEVHVLTFPHTIFDRNGTPFVYHSIPFGGWEVEWLVTGILKLSQTIQGSLGRKTALSKSNLCAILQFLFFSNKNCN